MTKNVSDQLKGLSILMVIGVHLLAIVDAAQWKAGTSFSWFLLTFDQLSRFSVPFFIFSSWYGLSLKAGREKIEYLPFVKARLGKLIPIYLLWCLLVLALMTWIPQWIYYPHFPAWLKVGLGLVDYQLYFVPLLTMLYLLFPFVQKFPTRWLLVLTPVVAAITLWWFKWLPPHYEPVDWTGLPPDASQYLWPLTWFWYGWLGLVAARIKLPTVFYSRSVRWGMLAMTIVLLAVAVRDVAAAIQTGRDILLATMFIRWPILAYATAGLVTALSWGKTQLKSTLLVKCLEVCGRYSLVLYLTHTMFIRWLVSARTHALEPQTLWVSLGILVVATAMLSWWLTYSSGSKRAPHTSSKTPPKTKRR